jgi:PAS domain S-box-containing protein
VKGRKRPRPTARARKSILDAARSARELAESARDQSQRHYRELVEHSLGLICAHDLEGNLLFVNPAAARSLGYQLDEGAGANLRDFLVPATRDRFDDYLQRIRRSGIDSGLMRLRARDGTERVWMYHNVLHNEPGEEPRVLGHALDITARVEAEQALRQSQATLKETVSEMDARVQARTSELQRVLIRERERLAFWTRVSDELSDVHDYETTLRTLARLPVPFLADWSLLHIVTEQAMWRTVAGSHANPKYQHLLDRLAMIAPAQLPDESCVVAVIGARRPGTVVDSPSVLAARFLGYGEHVPLIEELGPAGLLIIPLVIEDNVLGALSLASTASERFVAADHALYDDMARRFAMTIDRVRLYREAQEANRLKDEFLATLSHELRTPLNAILGWTRILRARGLDEQSDRAAEVIERNAEVQTRLIEDLLDVSRIITGKLTLNERPVDLALVLGAALDSIGPAARAKGIKLVNEIEPTLAVIGDEDRLQQVMWNLLSNAVKFTGAGGTVTVRLQQIGSTVEINVTDTGIGIRRDVLPFVFDRFRQGDASSTRKYTGLGLGLAIVRHVVELHGGRVTVESVEHEGASFTIELPIGVPLDFSTTGVAPRPPFGQASGEPLQGCRVLILDDERDARDLVAAILRGAGAITVTAVSVAEALDQIVSWRPDLLIADIGMPEEDGYQLIRRIRELSAEQGGNTIAVALTGYARAEDRARALEAGFQEHVAKPVEPHALVRVIRSALDTAGR